MLNIHTVSFEELCKQTKALTPPFIYRTNSTTIPSEDLKKLLHLQSIYSKLQLQLEVEISSADDLVPITKALSYLFPNHSLRIITLKRIPSSSIVDILTSISSEFSELLVLDYPECLTADGILPVNHWQNMHNLSPQDNPECRSCLRKSYCAQGGHHFYPDNAKPFTAASWENIKELSYAPLTVLGDVEIPFDTNTSPLKETIEITSNYKQEITEAIRNNTINREVLVLPNYFDLNNLRISDIPELKYYLLRLANANNFRLCEDKHIFISVENDNIYLSANTSGPAYSTIEDTDKILSAISDISPENSLTDFGYRLFVNGSLHHSSPLEEIFKEVLLNA